jgi:hypothetical protein
MLSVTIQYSINDRMINAYGAVGGMKTGRENKVCGENQPQYDVAHHNSHMT